MKYVDDELHKTLEALINFENAKIDQLDTLFHFLQEMTEITDSFLTWLVDYCEKNRIPLWKEEQLKSYVGMSAKILKDINESSIYIKELIKSPKLPRQDFHRRSPEDLPEPLMTKLIS
jgi:hypothetical protein